MVKLTRTEAFAHFGAKLTNPQWSWSAVTPDGSAVVLALWEDRFLVKEKPIGIKIMEAHGTKTGLIVEGTESG